LDEKVKIPILSFVGRSGTGKTTVIERLIPQLKVRGIRVATIKHHLHDFDIDREGKDSYRHKKAGAKLAMVVSPGKVALVEDVDRELGLVELISRHVHDVDLVITEGYKTEDVPRIEVYNMRSHVPPVSLGHRNLLALVTDMPMDAPVPVLQRDDIGKLAEFVIEKVMSEE
jgi:molybdopterin-guanine dinucleotide biosynthesis protein B